MSKSHPLAKVAAQCRQLLTDQVISYEGPGTLLRDVQILIDSIGTNGVPTQSHRGNLPSSLLAELNARFSDPLEILLKRPLLRDYPNVAGVYVLLRVMNLVGVNTARVWVNAERLAVWNELNPTERYFALLDAWLFEADGQVLGGGRQREVDGFSRSVRFLVETLSSRWKSFDEGIHKYGFLGGGVSPWNVQLMVRLGLIEVVPAPLEGRNPHGGSHGWLLGNGRRSPWGEALTWAIWEQLGAEAKKNLSLNWPFKAPEREVVQRAFQNFFPEYQNLFAAPPAPVQPGVYVFKVGFHPRYAPASIWRELAVPNGTSLYELGNHVLKAFKFRDDEHLHEFRYRDRTGREQVYFHPELEEGPYSDEISVGETDLPKKQTMEFLFDYGTTWKFRLRLERVEPPDSKLKKPKVIASAGVAPKQYESEGW